MPGEPAACIIISVLVILIFVSYRHALSMISLLSRSVSHRFLRLQLLIDTFPIVFSAPVLARSAQAPPVPVDDVRVPEVPSEEIQSAPDRGVLWERNEREREKG